MCRSEAETNTRISDRTVIPTERSERRNLQFQFASWSASGLRPPLTTAERNDKWNVVLSGNNLTNSKFKLHSNYGNQDFSMNAGQDWITANLSVIFKFGNYKQKNIKNVDTLRMGY